MRQDLNRMGRQGRLAETRRLRLTGSALAGLAILAWWTGRATGIW